MKDISECEKIESKKEGRKKRRLEKFERERKLKQFKLLKKNIPILIQKNKLEPIIIGYISTIPINSEKLQLKPSQLISQKLNLF
jgi:hypothetical protein